MLEVFRWRLWARLHLFSHGQIDDLHASLDELLVDVFHWACFGERHDDTLDQLEFAWLRGGDAALRTPRAKRLMDSLWEIDLDELERRIEALREARKWHRSPR